MNRQRNAEVEVTKVNFAWSPNDANIIDIAHFHIAHGERLFLSGPSGSGKSTLLSLLGGVLLPNVGSIHLLGQDLAQMSGRARDRFRADHIGFVFQLFNLVPYLSVLENVTLPCRFSARRGERAKARGQTFDKEARRLLADLELGDKSLQRRAASDLSIGQQQRVAVARALMGSPEVVIADEPTSALDEGTREKFLELLFAECERLSTTLLFVSHDQRLGALFDRQVALSSINSASQEPA